MELPLSETAVRLLTFGGVLAALAAWEALAPRRHGHPTRAHRRWHNLALAFLNVVATRIALPLGAVGAALIAEEHGWGVFRGLDLAPWLLCVLSVIALDFAIYLQHVLFHAVPVLWRLHLVHHADLEVDVTTGLRFHTLEMLISTGIKWAAVVFLGAPALAVLIFEVLLNATSMFNHANARLPAWLDRVVRLLLVTPDMHRVHHSTDPRETNTNFGFNLPWWDFLCGTYRAQPAQGHEAMRLGLAELRDERQVDTLPGMLLLPFVAAAAQAPAPSGGLRPPLAKRPPLGEHPPLAKRPLANST